MKATYASLAALALWSTLLGGAVFAQSQTSGEKTVHEKVTTIVETTTTIQEQQVEEAEAKTRLAAIFIKNRAGELFDEKLGAFEDLVVGQITDMGFRVMSPQDTIAAVRTFLGTEPDDELPGAQLDELLANNTSAVRLAQNMGVDYLIMVSITTFGKNTQHIKRPDLGIDRTIVNYKLRSTYKILDASMGDSISAGNILASKRVQQAEGFDETADIVNDLLADAASQIASKLEAKGGVGAVPEARKLEGMVDFAIRCTMQDLSIPEVVKDEEGNYTLTGNRYNLEPMSVTVELDGVVIGTAPNEFHAFPGLHKIRLTRENCKDWERTINIIDGQQLNVELTLTAQGRAYWMQKAEFFAKLKRDERISEADAELIRGVAQKMRQSGIRVDRKVDIKVDRKVDIKVDTKDAPSVTQVNVERQNVAASVWP